MPHRVTSVIWALLLSGCYRYAPFAAPATAPGSEVRFYLTADGTSRVASTLGPQTTLVAGRADAPVGDRVSLVVSSTTKENGGSLRWVGERVTIPLGAIARSERRVLDRRRTLLAGGGVALATAAGYAILRAVSGGGSGEGSGTPVPAP